MGFGLRRSGRTWLFILLSLSLYFLVMFLAPGNSSPGYLVPSRAVVISSAEVHRVIDNSSRPLVQNNNDRQLSPYHKLGKDKSEVGQSEGPLAHRRANSTRASLVPRAAVRLPERLGLDLIELATLPPDWEASADLLWRLHTRRQHVQEVCRREGLDVPKGDYQANAWEFLINKEHHLVWCNVFKAASSSWFWNFNLLAGYSEGHLLSSAIAPVELARKKYPRPTKEELQAVLQESPAPLSFMITRHPLVRLVSGYRNKILPGNSLYAPFFKKIYRRYKALGPPVARTAKNGKNPPKGSTSPSFRQFVQYILDEEETGQALDMHWIPQSRFCTPCLVNFTVFAKVETLQEDANYVIFTSGIDKVISPKIINRSLGVSTDTLTRQLLCQLLPSQMEALLQLYRLDLQLFDYEAASFRNCTSP
ncbi:carbohydrate sulfotransferase 11-like isoform X2 [Panulirus ornatus]|uniref:carbohydrate sulfotransferase 11-like isoform X2 n=1 Tax=Panulirus ornatus TaxID=150431 RepID=UPI003A86422B